MKKIFLRPLAVLLAVSMLMSGAFVSQVSAKSLWGDGNGNWGVFADRKAHNVGDILTIVISERTTLSTQKSTSNSKSGSQTLGAGTGIFDFLKAATISGEDEFSADGAASDTNRVTANIAVTVVDVERNGNLVVEGTQSIWQNRDEHKITLRGIVRPDDVTTNNTVPSNKVADATVRFDGKGPLNAKQRQGILTQVFNFLF